MSKKCCCNASGCQTCTTGTRAESYQFTVAGISQTNTPALDPTPPCDCATEYNVTGALSLWAIGGTLPAYVTDEDAGNYNCEYRGGVGCSDMSINGIAVYVFTYRNNSGGVSVYVKLEIYESSGVYLQGNTATYEGTDVIDAGSPITDCSVIDKTVSLTKTGDSGAFGGTLWCGGSSLTLRFETV